MGLKHSIAIFLIVAVVLLLFSIMPAHIVTTQSGIAYFSYSCNYRDERNNWREFYFYEVAQQNGWYVCREAYATSSNYSWETRISEVELCRLVEIIQEQKLNEKGGSWITVPNPNIQAAAAQGSQSEAATTFRPALSIIPTETVVQVTVVYSDGSEISAYVSDARLGDFQEATAPFSKFFDSMKENAKRSTAERGILLAIGGHMPKVMIWFPILLVIFGALIAGAPARHRRRAKQ